MAAALDQSRLAAIGRKSWMLLVTTAQPSVEAAPIRRESPASIVERLEQVAERLDVSNPTVRKWVNEGLLVRVPGRSPAEVTQDSVIHLERVLGHVRQNFPARSWTKQLSAFLHDRDLQGQEWFRGGIEQGKRGEYVEL